MKHFKKIVLFLILLVIIIPACHANENLTLNDNIPLSSGNDEVSISNIYFDASATIDGNGSEASPYNYLDSSRLADNSVAHFANGEYSFDENKNFYNLTIIGQDSVKTVIKGNSFILTSQNTLSISSITLNNLEIINHKDFTAVHVIFENNPGSYKGSYGNVFGGAVYSNAGNVLIDSSTFRNNNATYGGAIYATNTNLRIINSHFENNYAYKYGGAIASEDNSVLTVTNSIFTKCYTLTNAGGAIYSKESTLDVKKSNFTSCNATFGAAICDLKSNSTIDSIIASSNFADYQGGAIYKMYGKITIKSSSFSSNRALGGGAIFIDNSSDVSISSSKFNSNVAQYDGGAIYTILNEKESITSNTYTNNKANNGKDYYKSPGYSLVIGNSNYAQYLGDFSFNGTLPSKYDLRDYGQVTPIKHQKSGGNCWAFTSLSVLESCILKAGGPSLDLSEENMKNVMAYYSDYGWNLATNKGGYDDMGVGYLASWLGAVEEDLETFSDHTVLSPVLNSTIHVQNVIYLTRENYTDNNAIKEALIKYGAAATGIYYSGSYFKSNSYYYSGSSGQNHAVVIVGWDDNYSKNNFRTAPPGDGAWICRNSWGETWGDKGYFYVSYYDTRCTRVGAYDKSTYTIILNDTIHYDKNYQYDIIGITDYLITGNSTMWYENIFNATQDEVLTAFSTYFNSTTSWNAQVYVNNKLMLIQDGVVNAGYYTFNLDKYIPLTAGDTFKIVIKISADKYASVPVSEKIRSNRVLYPKGVSFFSLDGNNWIDLYDYKANMTEYGHIYESQVACIKAFTSRNINSHIVLSNPSLIAVNAPFNITAKVTDDYGNLINYGNVNFIVNSKTYTVPVVDGKAILTTKFNSKGNYLIQANYNGSPIYLNSSTSKTINVNITKADLTLHISDIEYGNKFVIENTLTSDGLKITTNVDVKIGTKTYTVPSNSQTVIDDILKPGNYTADGKCSNIASASTTFRVNKASLTMGLNILKTDVDAVKITVKLSKSINGTVQIKVNSKSYNVKANNGIATLELSDLDYGSYNVESSFSSDCYQSAYAKASFTIDVIRTNLDADNLVMYYHDKSRFYVTLKDKNNNPLANQNITITLNGVKNKKTTDKDGSVSIAINLNSGKYPVHVDYSGTDVYLNSSISRDITVKSTIISSDVVKYYKNGTQFYATILDYNGNKVSNTNVEMNINGVFYKRSTDSNGVVKLTINLPPDSYILTVSNPVTGENAANNITVLSRFVENNDLVKYYKNASKYSVKLLDEKGSPLSGVNVKFNINGVFYSRATDSNGVASLAINLAPGNYIITAEYDGFKVSNNIKVLNVIKTNDIVMSYRDGTRFKATILDGKGNPYPNQSVTFNINGVFYTKGTDATGVASLAINLQSGKYIITTSYNGLSAANTIEIKST
ncbi:MAG: Ig-like domain repeat protein [Methanobrevibacter sp.]|nr:Ig-like domain repeat protein [Methanobrevibacter sp.]